MTGALVADAADVAYIIFNNGWAPTSYTLTGVAYVWVEDHWNRILLGTLIPSHLLQFEYPMLNNWRNLHRLELL